VDISVIVAVDTPASAEDTSADSQQGTWLVRKPQETAQMVACRAVAMAMRALVYGNSSFLSFYTRIH
jgi:hypothetical protein